MASGCRCPAWKVPPCCRNPDSGRMTLRRRLCFHKSDSGCCSPCYTTTCCRNRSVVRKSCCRKVCSRNRGRRCRDGRNNHPSYGHSLPWPRHAFPAGNAVVLPICRISGSARNRYPCNDESCGKDTCSGHRGHTCGECLSMGRSNSWTNTSNCY